VDGGGRGEDGARTMTTRWLVLVFAASLGATAVAAGQTVPASNDTAAISQLPRDSALEARTSAVASQLRCPVCQGLSIQDSPSELAQSMRALVRDQLAEGKTPAEVKAYFVSKYGEWILLAPEPRGANLIAYAVPFVAILGGTAVIVFAVRRWTRDVPAAVD
jgi:cytochrome c-type biogenesis protein CcmH/NrfF